MSRERIQLWVDALRSGYFEQTSGVLEQRFSDGKTRHCCLGVACRVAMANGLDLRVYENGEVTYFGAADVPDDSSDFFQMTSGHLPVSVGLWLGVIEESTLVASGHSTDVDLSVDGSWGTATEANDSGKTFAEIADMIEKRYLS